MSPVIVATALSILALDSTAPTSQPEAALAKPAGAQDAAAAPDPNKRICRGQVVTGSRFERRICMTRSDWVEFDRRQQQELEDFKRRMNENVGLPSTAGSSMPSAN